MSGFPINLDLSDYFDDLRKYSSIFVNLSKFKDVRDVENHIKSVFGLEDNICLVHKKFLIPKSEDIQILQQYDIFKVQKCNFYDLQIHKTKKVNGNSTCDQKALNLTQSEKTIDLSCRPKQRIKANICPSPGVSGTLSLNIDHKKCTNLQTTPCEQVILLNGNHNIPKDKLKNKKKKCLKSDESDDDGNILDMSVKNSRIKKYSNCFSANDGSVLSDDVNDSYCRDSTKDLKKPKKRKKNSEGVDDASVDFASTCWQSLVFNDINIKDQNTKKKPKRGRENSLYDTHAQKSSVKSSRETIDFVNYSGDDKSTTRKKHKRSKKYGDTESLHDSEENQYYSNSSIYNSINNKKASISQTFSDNDENENLNESDSRNLEECKTFVKREIDRMLSRVDGKISDSDCHNDQKNEKPTVISNKQSVSDNNLQTNNEEISVVENLAQESSADLDCTDPKRKRKRKHNKKKKKEKQNCSYMKWMLAVGPTMNQLATQPMVAKSSPSSGTTKHVFFSEEEDVTAPSIPQVKPQTVADSSQPLDGRIEETQPQGSSSSQPASWQDQLLKLASCSSKPVVFHRNMSAAKTVSSPQPTHVSNANQPSRSTSERPIHMNPEAEDVPSFNRDIKRNNNNDEQNSSSGTTDGCSPRKGLPDICKPLPLPNDLQNINLSDYPIIDKVVAEDLILFKVLKLNETNEPGVSKPVLARVNGTSNFPDRISLQIMEGCEECSHYAQAEGTDQPFTIELRWSDILEPRLFYP